MTRLHWSLLIVYLGAAAGYGGWCGRELWSGWGVWWLALPPLACAALIAIGEWRRNWMGWTSVKIALVMGGVGVVGLFAAALGIAWVVADGSVRWSLEPAVRAIIGAGIGAAGGGMALLGAKSRKAAELGETRTSEQTLPAELDIDDPGR